MSSLSKLESIFFAALEKSPGQDRAAFLDHECSSDADLRQRVEKMLAAQASAGSFLEAPPSAIAIDPGPTTGAGLVDRPGAEIGPYKLLQVIGEGGMGVVYMAEQTEPVERKVALKVIKAGMDTRQVIARFEAERQALAMMDHVNIARVLDVGTTQSGRPYFVMELVHGVPITKYCDDNHLTPRQRLELFVPVCQAIQHAHQKGIIHRDIKPSNVMVTLYDSKPVPKVIDFGVAKATEQKLTERTLFTQYGTMVGTLEYMSPEQAEMSALGIDTRSDIFSLGVLLYELLTGSTPLSSKRMKEAAYAEIVRLIKEEEPPKPSTRLSDSGEALASISAQRQMEPAKLTKLVRGELDWIVMKTLEKDRNRRYETANGFAADIQRYLNDEPVQACPPSAAYQLRKSVRRNKAALAVAGLVLFFLVVLGSGAGWSVRDRAAREQEFARDRAARQMAIVQEANLARKEAEQWQAQEKWPEALSAAKRAQGLLAGGGSDELRTRVQQLRKDLEMVLQLEEIPLLRSEVSEHKFDYASSDRAYAKAFADYGIDVAGLPSGEAAELIRARSGVVVALLAAVDDWAHTRHLQGDRPGVEALQAVAQAADPDAWRRSVREALKHKEVKPLVALAASQEVLRQPPASLLTLAGAFVTRGLREEEIEVLRRAQRLYPGDFWINFNLAAALRRKGPAHRDEAISFLRAALAVRPQSSVIHNNLGVELSGQGKLAEAIAAYHKSNELDPKYSGVHNNLGIALKAQGKLDEAIAAYRKAIELDPKYSGAHYNLGTALADQEKLDEAIASYRKAIELDQKMALPHIGLGKALVAQGKVDEATASYRKAIQLEPKSINAHISLGTVLRRQMKLDESTASYRRAIKLDPKSASAHLGLGNTLQDQGKLNDAITSFRKAIELDTNNAGAHYNLGNALKAQGKLNDSIAFYHKAIELDPKLTGAHINLGIALKAQGKLEEAIDCYKKAIEINPKHADAHTNLGVAFQEQMKLDQAVACHQKAIELDAKLAIAHHNLGGCLKILGKLDEAIACYHKAIELNPKYATSHYFLGEALKDKGKFDEAIAFHKKATELDPQNALVRNNLGVALFDQKKWDEAIACFRKAIELDPKYAVAHSNLGNTLRLRGKLDEAVAYLRKAIELNPQQASAHHNLGLALKSQRKVDEAIASYRKAIELDPKVAQFHYDLGPSLSEMGQFEEALAVYRQAIELFPNNAGPHNGFAWLLATCRELELRDPAQAVALARKAVELDPKNDKYPNTLGVAQYRAGDWKAAVAALETSLDLRKGGDSFDWFFLAMAHWQLGQKDKAREWYEKAAQWMEKNQPNNEELRHFRTEAKELLKIEEKPTD